MSASMKVDVSGLKILAEKIGSAALRGDLEGIPRERAVAALIGQAIGDNFQRGGPGWPPLRIRKGRPLQKSGLLKKSATTPGAEGNIYRVSGAVISWGTNLIYAGLHQNGGTVTVKNAKALFIPLTKKAENVGPTKDKEKQKESGLKYGKDFIFKKSVRIPARPFLNLTAFWQNQIYQYMLQRMKFYVYARLRK